MNLIQASEFLARLKVGPKEGLALGVIAKMGGTAKACHVKERLAPYSSDPSAIISAIAKKGLVSNAGQVAGSSPFWSLTDKGRQVIATAKEGLER